MSNIGEIMTKTVVAAKPNATCNSLAQKMLDGFFSGMPVIDDEQHVIGIITEFDLLKVLRRGKEGLAATAAEVMTKEPIVLDIDQTVEEAIDLMTLHHIIRLPVVQNGKLVGVVSRSNILRSFIKEEFQIVEFADFDQ